MFAKIKAFVKRQADKITVALAAVTVMAAGSAVPAHAEGLTVDYSAIVTSITAQLTPALTAALGIAGVILGVKYGYRFFKSFSRG
ncbi:MAG: hypothetical protein LWW87_06965 [Geobacteraceae bacterium]|nr:hypothetical protein [Geobacteraceae bacterium]